MIKNKITCKSHISQRSFLYGWRTNNTRTEMTTSRKEKEKIDITHYSIDDKGIKQIWNKSQKCDFYALHLINCQTIIIFNHQFSRFSWKLCAGCFSKKWVCIVYGVSGAATFLLTQNVTGSKVQQCKSLIHPVS